ncbi:MAG: gliding motility-associated C-terminal domain-containing protein [Saprospiraceae bacterium]
MKHLTILFLYILCLINYINGQVNLVPNGSFEELTHCPDSRSQIELADPWYSPSKTGTPDLFSKCATDYNVSVPKHYSQNFQNPRTGNSYAGIFSYFYKLEIAPVEYLVVRLMDKLKKQKQYYLEFYISPRINNDPFDIPCYMEGLGMVLLQKDTIFNLKGGEHIVLQSAISQDGKIIRDSVNWQRMTGCYSGNSEEYILIGNFKSLNQTVVDPLCYQSIPNAAYYYIDDVGVYEFDPLPDTLYLCKGESTKIGAKFLDGSYLWNTGDRYSVIEINSVGTYIINVQMENCVLSDTVHVLDPEEIIEKQIIKYTLCKGERFYLEIPLLGQYKWSTGEVTRTIEISTAGVYSCEIVHPCGVFVINYSFEFLECDCEFYAPNVFSPNGDNLNDYFQLLPNCSLKIKILSFEVFDRWGEMLYNINEGDPSMIQWNGMFKQRLLPSGVYVWRIKYEYNINSRTIQKNQSGDVTIMH